MTDMNHPAEAYSIVDSVRVPHFTQLRQKRFNVSANDKPEDCNKQPQEIVVNYNVEKITAATDLFWRLQT